MKLRIFSIAGESLNFGARRMETIMRVAWLPVLLLLIVNMATVFAWLSVIAERQITFTEILTFTQAKQAVAYYMASGWDKNPGAMAAITGASLFVQMILVSSFLTPLIRFAGLGERPAPGLIKLAFGPDQVRFLLASIFSYAIIVALVLAPAAATSYYVVQYIVEALSQTIASFPNPESLHTIELVTAQQALAAKGRIWVYDLGIPLIVAAPLLALLWAGLMVHFHPRNRNNPGKPNFFLRAIVTGVAVLSFTGLIASGVTDFAEQQSGTGAGVGFVVVAIGALFYLYLNARLFPYAGVAVCRKSMAPSNMLSVSRGWNLLRLWGTLAIIGVILFFVQLAINSFVLSWIGSMIGILYQSVAVYTKLLNSGVTGEWVLPLFIWIWNGLKMVINVFWAFFSYGVVAGLYGRLYRESERGEI